MRTWPTLNPATTCSKPGWAKCIPASFGGGNTSAAGASKFAASFSRTSRVYNPNATVRGAPAGNYTAYCFTIVQQVTCVADINNPCCRPGDEKLLMKKVSIGTGRFSSYVPCSVVCAPAVWPTVIRQVSTGSLVSVHVPIVCVARQAWPHLCRSPTLNRRACLPWQQRPHLGGGDQVGIRHSDWTVCAPCAGPGVRSHWSAFERLCEGASRGRQYRNVHPSTK